MSSLRNAVQRRNHRERAQPEERKKWGLLEKRKDYKLRAADHKTKTKKLKALKQKASERNEDEFYFGMVSNATRGGIKIAKRGEGNGAGSGTSLDVDVVKLMKTQDAGYLRTMLQRTSREKARAQEEVIVLETGVKLQVGSVLLEDEESKVPTPQNGVDAEEKDFEGFDFDVDTEGTDDEDNAVESDDEQDLTPAERSARRRKQHALDVKKRKLKALAEQEEKLNSALHEVEHQRAQMNGTIGGVSKSGVKFKARQRKR